MTTVAAWAHLTDGYGPVPLTEADLAAGRKQYWNRHYLLPLSNGGALNLDRVIHIIPAER